MTAHKHALHLDLHHGFDRGNYANAYETEDLEFLLEQISGIRSEAYEHAAILGFFSTYELSEMGMYLDAYLGAYFSEHGKACREMGLIDEHDQADIDAAVEGMEARG